MATIVFPHDGGMLVWRDYQTNGNSSTPRHKPEKLEIRELTVFYQELFQDHEDRLLTIEDEIGTGIPTEGFDSERVTPHTDFDYFTGTIWKCAQAVTWTGQVEHGRYRLSGGAIVNWDCELAFDAKFATSLGPRDRDRLPLPGDYYVSWETGSDANAGTTRTAPMKNVATAYQNVTTSGGTIWVLPGVSHEEINVAKSSNETGGGDARPIKIKAYEGPGTAFFAGGDVQPSEVVWTLDSGGDIYRFTPTAGYQLRFVMRRFPDGHFEPIEFFADLAALTAAVGHWGWTQNDGTQAVYLRAGGLDLTVAENNDEFFFSWFDNGHRFLSTRTFIKDLDFIGGGPLRIAKEGTGEPIGELYVQNITHNFATSAALRNEGCEMYSQDCTLVGTWFGDGLSYTTDLVDGVLNAKGLEIGNVVKQAGSQKSDTGTPQPANTQCQGSSNHVRGKVIRINCWYENCFGAAAGDASEPIAGDDRTRVWMVGCRLGDPWVFWTSGDATPQPITGVDPDPAYLIVGPCEVWIDTCDLGGQIASYGIFSTDPAADCHVFRTSLEGSLGDVSGVTLDQYSPNAP